MKVLMRRLTPTAKMPSRATSGSAGFDLYADFGDYPEPCRLWSGESIKFSTGISLAIPEGYFGAIFARSGLATKQGLRPTTCVSVIDSDYRGPIYVAIRNDSTRTQFIRHGQRIAQLVILPCPDIEFEETEDLPETDRGIGGFGSTGEK